MATSNAAVAGQSGPLEMTAESSGLPPEFLGKAKCFLCDRAFSEGEEPWLMFETRVHEDGQMECSLSVVLESALGRELDEATAHSTFLCDKCNASVLEYENLEQRFGELRYTILTAYNLTAQNNDLTPISIEINGVLQDTYDDVVDIKNAMVEMDDMNMPDVVNIVDDDTFFSNSEFVSEEAAAAELVEEVQDVYEESTLTVEDPSKYAFAMIKPEPDGLLKFDSPPIDLVETVKMDGLEDVNIYDAIIEQTNSQTNYSLDNQTMDSKCLGDFSSNNSNQTDNLYTINVEDEGCDTNLSNRFVRSIPANGTTEQQQALYEQQGDDTYICIICNTTQEQRQLQPPLYGAKSFAAHMRSVHNTRFYACDQCSKCFLRRQDLKEHNMVEHHNTKEAGGAAAAKLVCETCQTSFTNQRLFRMHKRMHYTATKQFECPECHKKYSSKNMLDEHMNMHTGERPYKCNSCSKDFASKYTLQAHEKIHTDRKRPFQCDECNKSFLNQQNLTQHKKLHVGVKAFVCEICTKAFGTQHNLDVHKIVHTGQRPFICRTCGKSFARRAEIRDHERIHTGEKPFKCDQCSQAFAQRSNLMSHKKSTHLNEKLHKCDHCDRSFKRRRLLDYHVRAVHTGERPYKCDICCATFVYPEHFKKHMHIHTGTKPFSCEVCGKQFNSRDNRNAHRFVHSDKKPYECLECGAGFMRKPLLLSHMQITKHAQDTETIIVNQPHISGQGMLSLSRYEINFVDDGDEDGRGAVLSTGDDSMENMIKPTEIILPNIGKDGGGDSKEDEEDITSVNGQLIKDQIGDVKYLQFEDLDRDGHQTLTWVDIGGGSGDKD